MEGDKGGTERCEGADDAEDVVGFKATNCQLGFSGKKKKSIKSNLLLGEVVHQKVISLGVFIRSDNSSINFLRC